MERFMTVNHLRRPGAMMLAGLAFLGLALPGCGGGGPAPRPTSVQPIVRDVPNLLRGTIGTEVTFSGIQPVLISGYGLVVGLNGTGGLELPDAIASSMEREMGLKGIGKAGNYEGTAIAGRTPRQLLRDPNVAVVLVQAAVAPGLPEGSTFDVYVRAVNATSIEGGTLWTTDLRLGEATTFGQFNTKQIATARGPIFINPFAEPGKESSEITRTIGRVLDGGRVTGPLGMLMVLDNPSYSRAKSIVSAVNSRFPIGEGDAGAIARGMNDSNIELHVPRRFRDKPGDFIQLVRHLQIDQSYPEEYARRYVEGVKAEPALAEDVSWCLESLGTRALPYVRELYDTPELAPRMAGLKAGADLNDPRAAEYLRDLAKNGRGALRTAAIRALGKIDAGPSVDLALRGLLEEKELTVRIAAYEALAQRAEAAQLARYREYQASNPFSEANQYSLSHLEVLARRNLPPDSLQGIRRMFIADKFFLDLVPGGDPLIYVTQQGTPKIVLFGDATQIVKPMVVTTWSDRLMLSMDPEANELRVYYRPGGGSRAITSSVAPNLVKLTEMLARKSVAGDPRPGMDFSYAEVVGALHALAKQGGTLASFATEQDRLRASLLEASSSREMAERPEKPGDEPLILFRKNSVIDQPVAPQPGGEVKLVPIAPPTSETPKK